MPHRIAKWKFSSLFSGGLPLNSSLKQYSFNIMSNFITPHLIDESAIDRSFKSMAEIALKNSDHELNGSLLSWVRRRRG